MPPSKASGAPTAPIRRSRPLFPARGHRCESGEAVPVDHRAPPSTRSAQSRAANARPAGRGLFRPEDNLESPYARDALRQLYRRIYRGDVAGCSLGAFEDATGLSLTDDNGLKDDLPPITTFLNRLLALTIDMQAVLFSAFGELLDQRIEGAIAAGGL